MNKQRQALEKALEALQWNWGGEPLPTMELEAIEAIQEALAERELLLDEHASSQACHVAWKQCANTIDKFDGDPYGAFTMGFYAGIQASINAKHPPAKPAAYLDLSNNIAYSMRELSNEDAYDTDAMVPLYLSPPTRKPMTDHLRDATKMHSRKPLTEPELNAIEPTWPNGWNYDDVLEFVRTIERAHGIGEA